jgi:hypothetical protein
VPFYNTSSAKHLKAKATLVLATIAGIELPATAASRVDIPVASPLQPQHLIQVLISMADPGLKRQILCRLILDLFDKILHRLTELMYRLDFIRTEIPSDSPTSSSAGNEVSPISYEKSAPSMAAFVTMSSWK